MAKKRKRMSRKKSNVEEIVELVRRVSEQRRRHSDHSAAIQTARQEIASRGQFIPKSPGVAEQIKVCF